MKGKKTGSKLISFVLSVVMAVTMIPATVMAAPAADSNSTPANVDKVLSYAAQMRDENQKDNLSEGPFSWDTEGKSDTWRYFNGVMMDAFLMTGNADNEEFVQKFYDDNIDENGTIPDYATGELDSVEAARGLFDLLDTEQNSDRYKKAIQFVYSELEKQMTYDNCGGNYQHKQTEDRKPTESWSTWNIGLDGLYMAEPFLMECANAIADGTLTLENADGSEVTADSIYQAVYKRMDWVATTMKDESTGLYHHGWNVDESKGNGHFWSRGIGWYAMAQVDVIEMMPVDEYRTAMIRQLPGFFDAMLKYQDAETGMWYNVVNQDSDLEKNRLETSGSAMMAYALMKAYNNGYVTDAKYGEAGLKAFNGIAEEKISGSEDSYTVADIYQKSGVGDSDAYYCEQEYVNDEAKGTGALIMAATLANATADKLPETDPEKPTTPPTEPEEPELPQEPEASETVTGYLQGETRYELATDGVENGEVYLIVNGENALMNNQSTADSQDVNISGNIATVSENAELCEWTFTGGRSDWTITNGSQSLRLDSSDDIIGDVQSLTVIDRDNGNYRILRSSKGTAYYLRYTKENGWYSRSGQGASGTNKLYKKTGASQGEEVSFSVTPGSLALKTGSTQQFTPSVLVSNAAAESYNITWESDNPQIAGIDENGLLTAAADGTANITATLTAANGTGMQEDLTITVPVTVSSRSVESAELSGNTARYVKQNMEPDFSDIVLHVIYDDGTAADITTESGLVINGYDITELGTYFAKISYLGKQYGTVRVTVEGNPYEGLTPADPEEYPEYPDDGAVRIDKTATGDDFNSTGAVKVELDTAGISVKQGVDVVLVVDVSNSMGWTDDWFEGMGPSAVANAKDNVKIPQNGTAANTTDKLDQAMESAQEFADILLSGNSDGSASNNSISFVTFAGFDADNTNETGSNRNYIDSVQTVFTNVQDAESANRVFSNTKFTNYSVNGTSVDYTLQIGRSNGGSVSGTNRGNTNYDYAFGEANAAVTQLKNSYGGTDKYKETGREAIVVFMTDGAPSHYNGNRLNGSHDDTLYGTNQNYAAVGAYNGNALDNADTWLTYIKKPNEYAEQLNSNIDSFYAVGFDLDHGGFGDYSWSQGDLQPVLEGLAGPDSVDVTLVENGTALREFYNSLATKIKLAGTNAIVTDTINSDFTLQTTQKTGTGDEDDNHGTLAAAPTIEVTSYELYTKATTSDETLIGTRTGDSTVMEKVIFSEDGTEAYSDHPDVSGNIMTTDQDGNVTIAAKYFTYTKEISEDGSAVERFVWNIGDITDDEVVLSYYAYLTGAMEGTREKGDVYYTNEGATLEYVDINGNYAKKDYPMPAVAWGGASTSFEYYLVNENGEPVNRAGQKVPFANRIVIYGDTEALNLNQDATIPAQRIDASDYLPEGYYLYDVNAYYTVSTASSSELKKGITVSEPSEDAYKTTGEAPNQVKQNGAQTTIVISPAEPVAEDETYIQTRVAFGVRWDLTPTFTEYELVKDQIVLDYGKAIQADVLENDSTIPEGYTGELIGFTAYNANANLKQMQQSAGSAEYTTNNGTYTIDGGKANFQLSRMLSQVEKVFCVVKITEDADSNNYYYLYEELDIIPATNVYYETDFADGVFRFETTGVAWDKETVSGDIVADGPQDDGTIGQNLYGYDSSYANDKYQSDASSWFVTGADAYDPTKTTSEFSFRGTGFDIISRTDTDEGFIRVTVYADSAKTQVEKRVTVLNKSESQLRLYQIPVVSIEDLIYGTHYVDIEVYGARQSEEYPALSSGGQFHFDAVRIYNPVNASANASATSDAGIAYAAYVADGEADASIQEVRNMLIAANTFDETADPDDPDTVPGVSFIDRTQQGAELADYKTLGPNNEVYLTGDQYIGFKVQVENGALPASIDIGAKSANGAPVELHMIIASADFETYFDEKSVSINSSTAQFYELLGGESVADAFGENNYIYVLIDNLGDGVLSITDLKIASGSTAASAQIISDRDTVEKATAYVNSIIDKEAESVNYDILSADFTVDSIKRNKTATMMVTTSEAVESLQVQNVAGRAVNADITAEDAGDGTKTWTVTFKVTSVGNQKFTVTGYGADGTAGTPAEAGIKVTVR